MSKQSNKNKNIKLDGLINNLSTGEINRNDMQMLKRELTIVKRRTKQSLKHKDISSIILFIDKYTALMKTKEEKKKEGDEDDVTFEEQRRDLCDRVYSIIAMMLHRSIQYIDSKEKADYFFELIDNILHNLTIGFIFSKKQYRNVFALISEDIINILKNYNIELDITKYDLRDEYKRLIIEICSVIEEPPLKKRKLSENNNKMDIDLSIQPNNNNNNNEDDDSYNNRRLRYAEGVLANRTKRIALVLEKCFDSLNHQAILRTADCLGIQYIYVILPPIWKGKEPSHITKNKLNTKVAKNHNFLTFRYFKSTTDCINQLREDNYKIWVTDLSVESSCLDDESIVLPNKVAIVVGKESTGCSNEMLERADKRIYLKLFGFSDSLNLSVATALVLQYLFIKCPEARGDLSEDEKISIRSEWYTELAKSEKQKQLYSESINNPPLPLEDLRRCNSLKRTHFNKKIHKKIKILEASQQHHEEVQ